MIVYGKEYDPKVLLSEGSPRMAKECLLSIQPSSHALEISLFSGEHIMLLKIYLSEYIFHLIISSHINSQHNQLPQISLIVLVSELRNKCSESWKGF